MQPARQSLRLVARQPQASPLLPPAPFGKGRAIPGFPPTWVEGAKPGIANSRGPRSKVAYPGRGFLK